MPGANHPKLHSTSSSSYSLSFKKEAAHGWRTHRSKWRRQPSHDIILHQPRRVLGPAHNITALNQKFNMLETHVITTSNLLLEFITEIWKSAMWNIMVRDHHHHHKTRPSSSQPAVVVTAQRQVVRVRRKLLSIKGTEDSNSSTKFSHSSSSSSSSSHDFFDDYRDPETHPPKSN